MSATVIRLAIATTIALAGGSAGRAQTQVADFEMTITAPAGQSVIECHRGCDFQVDVGDTSGLPRPNTRFPFRCGGSGVETCKLTINGHGHVLR
jgi:hypothetical protein